MNCADAIDQLPFLMNGSLGAVAAAEVRAHLASCPSCRGEAEETARVGELFATAHPASGRLVALAFGDPLPAEERQAVDRHLAVCPRCREDLAAARESRDLPSFAAVAGSRRAAERRRRMPGARWLAAAAVLALVLLGGAAVSMGQRVARLEKRVAELSRPRVNAAALEALPEDYAVRAAGASAAVTRVPDRDVPVTLILLSEDARRFADYRLELLDADGRPSWEATGLERQPGGEFTVLLPPGSLPAGRATLVLSGLRDGAAVPVARYDLRVGED